MCKLDKDKIKSILKKASGWGCNGQPDINDAVEALYELEVTKIEIIDRDKLYFKSTKMLTIKEAFEIVTRLTPDECIVMAPNIYRLWWD